MGHRRLPFAKTNNFRQYRYTESDHLNNCEKVSAYFFMRHKFQAFPVAVGDQ